MFSFARYLTEEVMKPKKPENKALHCFDLDDTLFHDDNSKMRIHVRDKYGQIKQSLTSSEYKSHKLDAGHDYDFHEVRNAKTFASSSRPIRRMIAKLKNLQGEGHDVEIVTARPDLDDPVKFSKHLKRHGIDISKVHVNRAGNLNIGAPRAKAKIISDKIHSKGYKEVHLYDDSKENLEGFLSLSHEHPKVNFHAHHVDHNPKTGVTKISTKKKKAKYVGV